MTLEARLHGLSFIDILDFDGIVSPSGGDLKTDVFSPDGADYAEIEYLGREERTYNCSVFSSNVADVRRFVQECETAPELAEFWPFDSDLSTYIKKSRAAISRPQPDRYGGTQHFVWHADAEIVCRDNKFYGAEQGTFKKNVALPYEWTGTNAGTATNTWDYLMASGGYGTGYQTKDFKIVFNGESVPLIDSLIRGDRFVLDRFGNVKHTWESDFGQIYSKLQTTLGSDHLDYGTGGTCGYQSLFLNYTSKILIPFSGPLPISCDGSPKLEFYVTQMAGHPKVQYAALESLSDLADVDYDIKAGWNEVNIPDLQGVGFAAFGITCDSGSQITLREIKGTVERYLSEDLIPTAEPGEAITVSIEDGEWSNHLLNVLHFVYRDGYYF